jgi:hypothetical protein
MPLDKNNFFTSYAQNFEDIFIVEALKNIRKVSISIKALKTLKGTP